MVSICSAILFFSAIIAVVYAVAPFAGSLSIVPPILEISRITSLKYAGLTSFVIVAVLMSFGGLCVHLQLFSLFPEFPLSKGKFFLFRLLHGFLASGIFLLLARLFQQDYARNVSFVRADAERLVEVRLL